MLGYGRQKPARPHFAAGICLKIPAEQRCISLANCSGICRAALRRFFACAPCGTQRLRASLPKGMQNTLFLLPVAKAVPVPSVSRHAACRSKRAALCLLSGFRCGACPWNRLAAGRLPGLFTHMQADNARREFLIPRLAEPGPAQFLFKLNG